MMSEQAERHEAQVKELIAQAIDQDFSKANNTFNDVMTIKMSDLLDQEKVRLADQIYNGADPEDEEDLDLEDDTDAEEDLEDEAVQESDPDDEESLGDEGSDGSAYEEEDDEEDSEES